MPDKDAAAKDLVNHHFAVEPDLRAVYRILGEDETAAREPIKLFEINGATVATGTVEIAASRVSCPHNPAGVIMATMPAPA
jgi:hypothetical protein